MILSEAQFIAKETLERLRPHTERIDIAGSVRRRVSEPGDIELVCLPQMTVPEDLFGATGRPERSNHFVAAVAGLGELKKGKPSDGRYCCIILPEYDVQLDLFIPQPEDYYRQLAIRTGSRNYAHEKIAKAWIKKGWVGTHEGLRLRTQCKGTPAADNKTIWTCTTYNPTLPPAWKSEEEFFDWLGEKWIAPEARI